MLTAEEGQARFPVPAVTAKPAVATKCEEGEEKKKKKKSPHSASQITSPPPPSQDNNAERLLFLGLVTASALPGGLPLKMID